MNLAFMGFIKPNFHLLKQLILQTSFISKYEIFSKLCKTALSNAESQVLQTSFPKSSYPTLPNINYSRSSILNTASCSQTLLLIRITRGDLLNPNAQVSSYSYYIRICGDRVKKQYI